MSSYSTSFPVSSATRLLRMRSPVPSWNWWKEMSLDSVALYSFTGTFTSPKLIVPLQIARAIPGLYPLARASQPVEGDCAGNGHVERVDTRRHRDADPHVG